ncbi:MAG: sugar ABC transporter ATP-binding protein [Pleurocapsa minor GSE-CHR-MK-17-07R]|jgi:ABC-type sugar transport system ATPase subunit|nr:sugar ABC transporter ATP-binding protein [Pleurocapsa minor GSE-CHR-MK 17-07R]
MMSSTNTPLFEVLGATKEFGATLALEDASLTLRAGEVHALMGENGAGKSTLIKVMAGVTHADAVAYRMDGRPVHIGGAADAFRLGLRFIHQELNIVPQLSVAENMHMGQRYPRRLGMFVHWGELYRRSQQVLDTLGVGYISPRAIIARLSAGDQMLAKIASAFMPDAGDASRPARVYVLDEPTAALTGEEAERLFGVIQALTAQGCAVLYVSHRMDEIFRIAQRVTVMRDGRVVSESLIADTTPDVLIHDMTGRTLETLYPPRQSAISPEPLLSVEGLVTTKIRAVSFTLARGEIMGVAGLSASGRTELLRALMGADRKLSGRVALRGKVVNWISPRRSWDRGLAYVPEERRSQGLVLSRSIEDNAVLPHLDAFSRGRVFVNRRRERRETESLALATRLKARHPSQVVRELSGGNQQKVVFARALAGRPDVLLLDEPTRGIDVSAKHDIYQLIRQKSADGCGVLLVSSDLPELIGLCDRILVMRAGRAHAVVSAANLTQADLLRLCYGEKIS